MYIFQKSFQDSSLPDIWKSATVIPLFKKGSKLDPGNYRPVSLTCISCCKIMESIIRDDIAGQTLQVCQPANTVSPKEDLGFKSGRLFSITAGSGLSDGVV